MVGDELAAELYREQGCLFVASSRQLTVGNVVRSDHYFAGPIAAPLVVTGVASREDFERQSKRSCDLANCAYFPNTHIKYFYRVETD